MEVLGLTALDVLGVGFLLVLLLFCFWMLWMVVLTFVDDADEISNYIDKLFEDPEDT